ncbi:Uncharacterised protein [Mycobacteroides abscessus subsp. abscessus]|uniref:hypothetical protein n=1 Tax=Mycobacteroides abscessus TaxID=36809 RepID=UPI0009CDEC7E|nr:hypothetical protein [Mycobacteroides abscessus]SLI19929.1 Uncharacterised protein [Mycobacteroides abscessus subsp. abscessus]
MMKIQKIVAAAAICVAVAGCSANERLEPGDERGDDPMPYIHVGPEGSGENSPGPHKEADPESPTVPQSYGPPGAAQERACGAFSVIDTLSRDAASPMPVPGPQGPGARGDDLIGFGNALNQVDRRGLPKPMNAALNAHAVALTSLGALFNHKASSDDVADMAAVAKATGNTVITLCAQ